MDDRCIVLTRRVAFSSGHRFWLSNLNAEENQARFGDWASPFNHGHNYVLEASVVGTVVLQSGMVVNIKDIDLILKNSVVTAFGQKSLNDEVPEFANIVPTLENFIQVIRRKIEPDLPAEVQLKHLKLIETEDLYAELQIDEEKDTMTLTRTYEFAAAHRLHSDSLSLEENLSLFGKCNNEHGHGHNYVVEVTVTGAVDPETGMMVDICELDRIVNESVIDRYDHKNLNVEVPELQGKVTTSEVIAQSIFDSLQQRLGTLLFRVRLYETARSWFEVCA